MGLFDSRVENSLCTFLCTQFLREFRRGVAFFLLQMLKGISLGAEVLCTGDAWRITIFVKAKPKLGFNAHKVENIVELFRAIL